MTFSDTGLDPRILRALSKQGLTVPTTVQTAAIPAALQGKDVLARARTGSGKTLAYLLPALHKVITGKRGRQPWQVLVLVPTRELCDQVKYVWHYMSGHERLLIHISLIGACSRVLLPLEVVVLAPRALDEVA